VRQRLGQVLDDLGRRVSELRRARGWTQAEAAAATGMADKDFQAIENGRRAITVRTALEIANVFGVPLRSLFDQPASREPRRPGRPRTGPRRV
jgi:putative transcriptional regulator